MSKKTLKLTVHAVRMDDQGNVEAEFGPFPSTYNGLSMVDAHKIEASFAQSFTEHGQRLLEMGQKHAIEKTAAEKKPK